jgi:hypothetical protein
MHEPIIQQRRKSVSCSQYANYWHKRISSNLAFALLVSVMWHIVLIQRYLSDLELVPLYALWIFIGLILVPARVLDRQWEIVDSDRYSMADLQRRFYYDQVTIWMAAFVLPYLWVQAIGLIAGQVNLNWGMDMTRLASLL